MPLSNASGNMNYHIKEVYYTLQGEGAHAGRAAVFCRFAGCNLWSGFERDRAAATCDFCDTDFVGTDGPGGGIFKEATDLADTVAKSWPKTQCSRERRLVVCTGGEPLLQLDKELTQAFHDEGFTVAIETNGTRELPPGIDWVCVSPKSGSQQILKRGNEIKLVFPQQNVDPRQFEEMDFQYFFLQPMDGPDLARNTALATQYCLEHPRWMLSIQRHKLLGMQ